MAASVASGPGGLAPPDDGEVARLASYLAADLAPRYHLLGYISRGAFATVWRALDRQTMQTVAIKRFDPARTDRGRDFYGELRSLFRLQHPSVVRVHNFLETAAGHRCLILEYCSGGSLRAALRRSPARIAEQAGTMIAELAAGLAAAHALGIVHRDLKPENVLLRGSESRGASLIKIADFGLARPGCRGAAGGRLGGLTGSPAYMAPEQFAGEFCPPSDLYALGVIAWELLHGRPPFTGGPEELARQHVHARLPRVARGVPWDTLLPALLDKNPDRRPAAAEVARMLIRSETPMHDPDALRALEAEEESLWQDLAELGQFAMGSDVSQAETLSSLPVVSATPAQPTVATLAAPRPMAKAAVPAAPPSTPPLTDQPKAVDGFFDAFGWQPPAESATPVTSPPETRHDAFGTFQWD